MVCAVHACAGSQGPVWQEAREAEDAERPRPVHGTRSPRVAGFVLKQQATTFQQLVDDHSLPQLIASTGARIALRTLTIFRRMVNGGALWPLSVSTARTLLLLISCSFLQTSAQSISTNAEVPPLQWINLSDLLKGSKPQPVKDAAIGYDGTNVVIFGGESAGGISVSTTYL